ncbi:PAAR domain-containing protein [Burkholderia pseudomallei]|uniref:PAAR domain-containing protein n=1 Tax=Burkholderia pseudomallei TaxID=28450 RepID=UPI0010431175|nr:PAAR domain-containing protein [Burkholderia pseudomallei]QBL88024.1 PAAR domain-containing protein [Burkholderia pseudomallei]
MVKRAIICVGDTTTHGGKVLEGAPTFTLNGRNVAGVGHQVLCPRCKGIFPILPDLLGRRYPHTIGERDTAVEGMRTACGAELIASQGTGTIDDVDSGERGDGGLPGGSAAAAAAVAPSPTLCLECLKAAAKNAATMVVRG